MESSSDELFNNKLVFIKKWILFSIGITFLSLGITMTIWARKLGVAPWDVFHLGLMNLTGYNYGIISFIVGIIAITVSFFLGVKPKIGTVINMIIISILVNFFLHYFPFAEPITYLENLMYFISGILILGIGTALYIAADVGAGPRDSLMLGIHYKFGIRIGWTRTGLEVFAVVVGYLLDGPVGIGTLMFSLTIGLIVDYSLLIINRYLKFSNNSQERNV